MIYRVPSFPDPDVAPDPFPPVSILAVETDPFPEEPMAAPTKKKLEEKRMRNVALAARRLVRATRAAEIARSKFPGAALVAVTEAAVLRAFARLETAVGEWDR